MLNPRSSFPQRNTAVTVARRPNLTLSLRRMHGLYRILDETGQRATAMALSNIIAEVSDIAQREAVR